MRKQPSGHLDFNLVRPVGREASYAIPELLCGVQKFHGDNSVVITSYCFKARNFWKFFYASTETNTTTHIASLILPNKLDGGKKALGK